MVGTVCHAQGARPRHNMLNTEKMCADDVNPRSCNTASCNVQLTTVTLQASNADSIHDWIVVGSSD